MKIDIIINQYIEIVKSICIHSCSEEICKIWDLSTMK